MSLETQSDDDEEEENDASLQYTRVPPLQTQNLTLHDVYAPEAFENVHRHWVHKTGALFAMDEVKELPSNVRPMHYELEVGFVDFLNGFLIEIFKSVILE